MAQGGIDWKQEAQGRERIYFFIFLLLVPVMFGRVLWGPKRAETAHKKKDLEAVMLQVETLKKRLGDVKKIQASRAAAQPVEAVVQSQGVDERFAPYLSGAVRSRQDVMSEIVGRLTGPNALQGLALNGHSIGVDVDAGIYLAIPLEVNIEGPFAALVRYFDAVEKMPLLLTIDNIALSTPPETPAKIQSKLSTTAYVVKSAAALTAGAVPAPGSTAGAPAPSGEKK